MAKERVMTVKYVNKAGETIYKTYRYKSCRSTSSCLVGKTTIHKETIKEFKSTLTDEQRAVFNEMLKDAIINKKYLSTNHVEIEFKKIGL